MKSKKSLKFDSIKLGGILEVTFNLNEIVDYTEQQKKAYKMLTENTRYVIYTVDKNGNYKLLKEEQ